MDQTPTDTIAKEVEFDLNGLTLHGLHWHQGAKHRVIALHGWLDNCASFSCLMPSLPELDCVAIDLAGHGRSDFRNDQAVYSLVRDLREVLYIAEQLAWDSFSIIGHSRGAMIASLLAGSFPNKINKVYLIDSVVPPATEAEDLPARVAASIDAIEMLDVRKSTMFSSYEKAVAARASGRFPLSLHAAGLLAERAVLESESGYYWRYDPWLLVPTDIRLNGAQTRAFVDRFPTQVRALLAHEGILSGEDCPEWYQGHPNLEVKWVTGNHHLHMSDDANTITTIVDDIREYFDA